MPKDKSISTKNKFYTYIHKQNETRQQSHFHKALTSLNTGVPFIWALQSLWDLPWLFEESELKSVDMLGYVAERLVFPRAGWSE